MSHFIMPYAGNKRNEYKYLKKFLNFNGTENIIEPFCGSSAISFNIWLEHPNLHFYLNDVNKDLIAIYHLLKTNNIDDIYDVLNKYKKKYNDKDKYEAFYKDKQSNNILKYIFIRKTSSFHIGKFNTTRNNNKDFKKPTELQLKFIKFIKSPNVHIYNKDWKFVFNKFKNNDKSIIIFDPPYINSYNEFYNNKKEVNNNNVYEYFYKHKITNFKPSIYFILEDIKENKLIFGDNTIIKRYNKKYEISKKLTHHIIISNK